MLASTCRLPTVPLLVHVFRHARVLAHRARAPRPPQPSGLTMKPPNLLLASRLVAVRVRVRRALLGLLHPPICV